MIGATTIRFMLLPEELDKRVKVVKRQHEIIHEQYAAGMTQKQLADNYGCSQRTIYNILHPDIYAKHLVSHRAYMRAHPEKRNGQQHGYQTKLLSRKKKIAAMSSSPNLSAFKLSCALLPSTSDMRRRLTDEQREEIRHRYATEKCTYRSLATDYGCSASTIGLVVNPAALERAREGSRQYSKLHRREQDPKKVNAYQQQLRARKRALRDAADEEARNSGTSEKL